MVHLSGHTGETWNEIPQKSKNENVSCILTMITTAFCPEVQNWSILSGSLHFST